MPRSQPPFLRYSGIAVAEGCVVDDREQYHYYRAHGYFENYPQECLELCDIVARHTKARRSEDEIWIAVNLGVGLADIAVAKMLYDEAVRRGIGRQLEP